MSSFIRYDIALDYDYHGNELGVEIDPEGYWVSFEEAEQRIKELEKELENWKGHGL